MSGTALSFACGLSMCLWLGATDAVDFCDLVIHKCIGLPLIDVPKIQTNASVEEQMGNRFSVVSLPDASADGERDDGDTTLGTSIARRFMEADCQLMCLLDECIARARVESNVDPAKPATDGYSCFSGSRYEDTESLASTGCLCHVPAARLAGLIAFSMLSPFCCLLCCVVSICSVFYWHG
eukprot:CAMPEP_0194510470 /NCGR_PEP_ID=MMETSP0253-20130528/41821_1 /TAXON_ID=2966 /ORGANISM="Noctiluca scintillans" /LENGTH=180 /DNA_ID=CAMNT_0039353709 /DNA_START=32 /DNA_END=571 /DNA_ORIENTATION=-